MASFRIALLLMALPYMSSAAREPPTITAEDGKVTVQATDLLIDTAFDNDDDRTSEDTISVAAMYLEVKALRSELDASTADTKALGDTVAALRTELDALKSGKAITDLDGAAVSFSNSEQVLDAIDAAIQGVSNEVLGAQALITGALGARVDGVVTDIAGLPETMKTVDRLAADMNYVIAHTKNITECAADGAIHLGSGECVSAVPQCDAPKSPAGGTMALSSEYIIPGVTATYQCSADGTFLLGPEVRTCIEKTRAFSDASPTCPECKVDNCVKCKGSVSTCGDCAFGFDATEDKKHCNPRSDTIVVLGGRPQGNGGHNFNDGYVLLPNAEKWARFLPNTAGGAFTYGAGAMIEGTIYVMTALIAYQRAVAFRKLAPGGTQWELFKPMSKDGATKNKPAAFYGATNTKFYVLGTATAEAYSPKDDAWQTLASVPTPRASGATAVLPTTQENGKQYYSIYCLGGIRTDSNAVTDVVEAYDTKSNSWSTTTKMTKPRKWHAAAAYNGKIVVIGGMDNIGLLLKTVEVYDPSSKLWATKTPLPEAWSDFTSGPMPVLGGNVILPCAHTTSGRNTALQYNIDQDTWTPSAGLSSRRGQYIVVTGTRK